MSVKEIFWLHQNDGLSYVAQNAAGKTSPSFDLTPRDVIFFLHFSCRTYPLIAEQRSLLFMENICEQRRKEET